jgi:hypothetical protein
VHGFVSVATTCHNEWQFLFPFLLNVRGNLNVMRGMLSGLPQRVPRNIICTASNACYWWLRGRPCESKRNSPAPAVGGDTLEVLSLSFSSSIHVSDSRQKKSSFGAADRSLEWRTRKDHDVDGVGKGPLSFVCATV